MHLGLVDLSQTPSGTFFREVHPVLEMGYKHRQNRLLPAVCDLAPTKARKTFLRKFGVRERIFVYIAGSGIPIRTLLKSYGVNRPREPRRSVFTAF